MSSLGKALSDAVGAGRGPSADREAPDPTGMSAFGLRWTPVEDDPERFATSAKTHPAAPAAAKSRGDYDDIIDLSRPKSLRPSMPLRDRAAQFAPFAALTGYDASVQHAARAAVATVEEIDRGIPIELEEMVLPVGVDFDE